MLYGMDHFLLDREASAGHWRIGFACRVSKSVTVGEGHARCIAVIKTIIDSNKNSSMLKMLPSAPNAPSLPSEVVVVNSLKFFLGNCWYLAGILILSFSRVWGLVCYTLSFKLSDK